MSKLSREYAKYIADGATILVVMMQVKSATSNETQVN